jgi:hypothetical protein
VIEKEQEKLEKREKFLLPFVPFLLLAPGGDAADGE